MTHEERQAATRTVIAWITEYRGPEVADWWAWERTPMPAGLPLDEQLNEGVRLALGETIP